MNFRILSTLGALALATVLAAPAQALEVTAVGGLNISTMSSSSLTTGVGAKSSPTFGVLLGYGLVPGFGLELGVISTKRGLKLDLPPISLDESYTALEIPVLLRFTLLPFVSAGAGVTYVKNGSKIDYTVTPAGSTMTPTAIGSSDIAATLDARAMLPILPLVHFGVDLRYLKGLKDQGDGVKVNEMQVLGAVSVGF